MCSQKLDLLKLQLQSAMKHKLLNEKFENQLRSTYRILSEELSCLKIEINLLTDQLEELMKTISEMKYQIANIQICNVSEQCKMEHQIDNLNDHSNGFKNLFTSDFLEQRQDALKAEETEAEELRKRELEIKDMQDKKAVAIEKECESIESECTVLQKRNKAIMLKLRRKLLETDEIRRKLVANNKMQTF